MLENLFNNLSFGQYLQEGAAISYDELQKRIASVQVMQQQQAVAAGIENMKQQNTAAQQAARSAAIARGNQARYAVDAANNQIGKLQELQNLANDIYKQTNGAYEASISNMYNTLNTIVSNTNAAVASNIGQVRAQYGSSDILVDTGSSKDVQMQVGNAVLAQGQKDYSARVNQIADTISKVTSMALENKYNNMDYNSQKELIQINLNRSLNG